MLNFFQEDGSQQGKLTQTIFLKDQSLFEKGNSIGIHFLDKVDKITWISRYTADMCV